MTNDHASSGFKSAEDVVRMYREAFPPKSGELFFRLWNDVVFLQLHWQAYRSLFGTSPERVDTLNWAASQFFHIVEQVLRNDIVMRIARLTDPAASPPGRENASLERLLEALRQMTPAELLREWEAAHRSLRSASEKIRLLRNRSLAHADLNTMLHYEENPLPGISRAYIEEVLGAIRELMRSIELHFRNVSMRYEDAIPALGDAECLVARLEEARKRALDRR